MSISEIKLTELMAGDVARSVRTRGLALKKIDNRPNNEGMTPEMALACEIVKQNRVEDGRVRIDAPRVTPDEATELMAHHLAMAAAYYEATPSDSAAVHAEVTRILRRGPVKHAGHAFLRSLDEYYRKLMEEQDAQDSL